MTVSLRRYLKVKRGLDIVLSLVLLIVLSPLFVIIAVASFVTLGRPVLFTQARPGYKGRIFKLFKFRSMKNVVQTKHGDVAAVASDAQRLTRYGAFLRKTSLDELPELFNILKGDMSFVGPRPLLVEYLPLYSSEQARRHDVRPGLTGLAQVRGRNALSWAERFAYDVEYVDTLSFKRDCSILWQTVAVVLTQRGISSQGSATQEPFTGENEQVGL